MVQLLLLDDALYPTLNEHPVSKGHNPLNCISIDVTNTTSLVESHENCAQRDASIMINDLEVADIDLWKYVDDTTISETLNMKPVASNRR